MDIVLKIENLKRERGWTDYELSQRSLLTQSTITSIKSRKSPPKIETLQSICYAFGITLSQFFLEDEQLELLCEQEKIMLKKFRSLSPKKQLALIELL